MPIFTHNSTITQVRLYYKAVRISMPKDSIVLDVDADSWVVSTLEPLGDDIVHGYREIRIVKANRVLPFGKLPVKLEHFFKLRRPIDGEKQDHFLFIGPWEEDEKQ